MRRDTKKWIAGFTPALILACTGLIAAVAQADDPPAPVSGYILKGNTEGKVSQVVSQFELAYMNKNKDLMLLKLMAPTTDAEVLKRRYQWLRGYGPDEKPEAAKPPILFASKEGSFVPKSYTLFRVKEVDKDHWKSIVYENGTLKDDRGMFKVKRTRYFTLVRNSRDGKWYIQDYTAKEGQKDYAFAIDESVDTLTKADK